MRRAIAAFVVAVLLAAVAVWLHRRQVASMAIFERGYAAAPGDAGAP